MVRTAVPIPTCDIFKYIFTFTQYGFICLCIYIHICIYVPFFWFIHTHMPVKKGMLFFSWGVSPKPLRPNIMSPIIVKVAKACNVNWRIVRTTASGVWAPRPSWPRRIIFYGGGIFTQLEDGRLEATNHHLKSPMKRKENEKWSEP